MLRRMTTPRTASNLASHDTPQADRLWVVLAVPAAVEAGATHPHDIGLSLGVASTRHADYYVAAARILDLVAIAPDRTVSVTTVGAAIARCRSFDLRRQVQALLWRTDVTRAVLTALDEPHGLLLRDVATLLRGRAGLGPTTAIRRAQTILRWLRTAELITRHGEAWRTLRAASRGQGVPAPGRGGRQRTCVDRSDPTIAAFLSDCGV